MGLPKSANEEWISQEATRPQNLKCFNCGGPHVVYECEAEDFDPDRVETNRRASSNEHASRREQNRHKGEKAKIGTWSLQVTPKNQSAFDSAVNVVLETANEKHHMVELDDDLEFCMITGIENEEEQDTLKKSLEQALPKHVEVKVLGRISAASIKCSSERTEPARSSLPLREAQRVDKLEKDMKLVKTDLVEVKSMQAQMNTRMDKMHSSIEQLGERKSEESSLLRSLAKKLLDPSEIPPTPKMKSSRRPKQSQVIPETPDSDVTEIS